MALLPYLLASDGQIFLLFWPLSKCLHVFFICESSPYHWFHEIHTIGKKSFSFFILYPDIFILYHTAFYAPKTLNIGKRFGQSTPQDRFNSVCSISKPNNLHKIFFVLMGTLKAYGIVSFFGSIHLVSGQRYWQLTFNNFLMI